MAKVRITPFLIINPIVIIWATHALIVLLNRDGMAPIMSGFFIGLIVFSAILLIVDRLVSKRVNIFGLVVIEVSILLGSLMFIDRYV
jgi:hypothetical protein